MNRFRLRLVVLGVTVFLVTLVMKFPAARVVGLLEDNIRPTLQWNRVSGTAFDARFEGLMLKLPNGRSVYLKTLELDTSPLALFIGRLHSKFYIISQAGFLRGSLAQGLGGWRASDINGEIRLDQLQAQLPELRLLGARGDLVISAEDLAGDHHSLPSQGSLIVTVKHLRVDMIDPNLDLGSYNLTLDVTPQNHISALVRTVPGENLVFIEGEGDFDLVENIISFQGQGWVAADSPDTVKDILPLLGEVKNGRALIDWRQRVTIDI